MKKLDLRVSAQEPKIIAKELLNIFTTCGIDDTFYKNISRYYIKIEITTTMSIIIKMLSLFETRNDKICVYAYLYDSSISDRIILFNLPVRVPIQENAATDLNVMVDTLAEYICDNFYGIPTPLKITSNMNYSKDVPMNFIKSLEFDCHEYTEDDFEKFKKGVCSYIKDTINIKNNFMVLKLRYNINKYCDEEIDTTFYLFIQYTELFGKPIYGFKQSTEGQDPVYEYEYSEEDAMNYITQFLDGLYYIAKTAVKSDEIAVFNLCELKEESKNV